MPSGLAGAVVGWAGAGSPSPRRASAPCAPRSGFRSAEGLRFARPLLAGPFGRSPTPLRGTQAQKAGIRYERKVTSFLRSCFFDGLQVGPWFEFLDVNGGRRYCQPDALWLSKDKSFAIIFEVKIRFTSDAYYQLRKLYAPVVRKALEPQRIGLVNVCRSFDPAVPFPEPVVHLQALSSEVIAAKLDDFCVYTWRL